MLTKRREIGRDKIGDHDEVLCRRVSKANILYKIKKQKDRTSANHFPSQKNVDPAGLAHVR